MICVITSGLSGSCPIACLTISVCASARRLPRVPKTIVITYAATQSPKEELPFARLDSARFRNPGHASRSDHHTLPLLFFEHRAFAQRSPAKNPNHKRRRHQDNEQQV